MKSYEDLYKCLKIQGEAINKQTRDAITELVKKYGKETEFCYTLSAPYDEENECYDGDFGYTRSQDLEFVINSIRLDKEHNSLSFEGHCAENGESLSDYEDDLYFGNVNTWLGVLDAVIYAIKYNNYQK